MTPTADLVAHLAAWAQAQRTGAALMSYLKLHLSTMAAQQARDGVDPATTVQWLGAVVAAPDLVKASSVGLMLNRVIVGSESDVAEWLALGVAGPYAFAAGLSPAEAGAGLTEGALTPSGLRSLAGLRGWVFPPPLST